MGTRSRFRRVLFRYHSRVLATIQLGISHRGAQVKLDILNVLTLLRSGGLLVSCEDIRV